MERQVGDYAVEGRIAVGGMAEIYRARVTAGPEAGQLVVLKRLLPAHRADPAFIERFVTEAKLAVKLRHPNIVRTMKLFKKEIDYFMVQELVDGPSLMQLVEHARRSGQPLSPAAATWACHECLKALDYLHRATLAGSAVHVVHRDVNPANLLVGKDGSVKLTDFGVAEAEGIAAKAERGALAGTLAYMSPEQVVGKPLDPRADLWAAGVMLWEMAANRTLFEADTELGTMERVRAAQVPPLAQAAPHAAALSPVVHKALSADLAQRFASARAFMDALAAAAKPHAPSAAALAAEVRARVL